MSEAAWRDFSGKGVRVRAAAGSDAARLAPKLLDEAERIVEELEDLLHPERPDSPIDLYLVDPEDVIAGLPAEADVAVLAVGAEGSHPGVVGPLTRSVVASWFGPHAALSEAIVDGIAGVAAARGGTGPSIEQADLQVRERLRAGRPVSVVRADDEQRPPHPGALGPPPMEGPPQGLGGAIDVEGPPPDFEGPVPRGSPPPDLEDSIAGGGPPPDLEPPTTGDGLDPRTAETSFVAYLISTFGGDALRAYLQSVDPERIDQAALTAFQQPLGSLEEAWLHAVSQGGPGPTIAAFVRYVLPHLKPYWWREAEVLAYMLIGSFMGVVVMPVAIGAAVGALAGKGPEPGGGVLARMLGAVQSWLLEGNPTSKLVLFIAALFAIYTFDALITMRRAVVSETVTQRLLMSLQERMFAHLQRLPHSYYSYARVGDVMARVSGDIQLVSQTLTEVLNQAVFIVISTVIAGIAVLSLNLWLGLLVLVVVPIFFVTYKVLGRRLGQASYERGNRAGEASNVIQENLTAQAVIKAFGLEERAMASYHARLQSVLKPALRLVRISALFDAATSTAVTLGQLLVLGVGGWLLLQGKLSVGVLLAMLGLLPSLLQPLAQFTGIGETVQETAGSLARVSELLDVPITITDRPDAVALAPLTGEIRLDRVTFSYDGARAILEEFDLAIPAGSMAAVVGPSGSGKSTIVNLLLRFWDPQEGRVLFDGRDLRDVTLGSLRSQIGLVFQDTFVFDTTVRENIAIGRPDASDDEIAAAAKGARLSDYIESLTGGYDAVLGERGLRMSGGQRQRLAIARVLLRDPRIMVLDEATSALDAETENGILETFDEVVKGRTTIAVTHRLSLAAKADVIFVIDQGRLVEEGIHAELSTAGGLYQRLYEAQTRYTTGPPGTAEDEMARLHDVPMFAGLSNDELSAVAAQLRPESCEQGQDIVRQGDAGDRMFLIDRGNFEVVVERPGGQQRIAMLGPGDLFGEMALLAGVSRSATVRATTPGRLFGLTAPDFTALLDRHPLIRAEVARVVAARAARASTLAAATAATGPSGSPPAANPLTAG